jgi:hypothetical protein
MWWVLRNMCDIMTYNRFRLESRIWIPFMMGLGWDSNFDEWDWVGFNKFFISSFQINKLIFHLKIQLLVEFLWKQFINILRWETLTSILWCSTTRTKGFSRTLITKVSLSEGYGIGIGMGMGFIFSLSIRLGWNWDLNWNWKFCNSTIVKTPFK